MGTWGPAISSNDVYEDVYREFMDLYDEGLESEEISKRVIDNNSELINSYEDENNFWFALAMAQWQCRSLDPELYQQVKQIVETSKDIKLWEELGATPKEIQKRKKVLTSFIEKLSTPKEKARRRRKKVLRDSIFQKGDCLIFKLENGNYGGAFVLAAEEKTEYGMNLIAITTLNLSSKPTDKDFKNTFVLTRKKNALELTNPLMIHWYVAKFFKKAEVKFEVVGQLSVDRKYRFEDHYTSAAPWDFIKEVADYNIPLLEKEGRKRDTVKLKKLRKKFWFLPWE